VVNIKLAHEVEQKHTINKKNYKKEEHKKVRSYDTGSVPIPYLQSAGIPK
jgi:hypothetical protein